MTVVIVVMPLIITGILVILDQVINSARTSSAQAELQSDVAFAADWLERDIRLATSFESTISSPYADATYQPVGGWDYAGSGAADRVLILGLPATSLREGDGSRMLTYESDGYNCTTELTYNPVLTYRAVYFVDNGTLYRRVITDTGVTTSLCNTQSQKQSCPAIDKPSWPSSCEARDEVLAENVTGFAVDYFDKGEETPIANAYSDSTVLATANAVGVELTLSMPVGDNPLDTTLYIRSARIN